MDEIVLPLIFLFIAFFYSSVGFGGGSSYLAILSLVLVEFYEIRTLALVLNIAVVGIGTIMFIRNRVFSWKLFWPFIACSVPVAFFGAQLRLSEKGFFLVLGSSLILSAFSMFLQTVKRETMDRSLNLWKRMSLGGGIGLLSGVAGIGGGIFLSPTLNLVGWKNPRIVASLASVFILFNSLAGLAGLFVADSFAISLKWALPLLLAVIVGGSLGSYLSNRKLSIHLIRGLTALMVAYVGIRLVLVHGFGIKI